MTVTENTINVLRAAETLLSKCNITMGINQAQQVASIMYSLTSLIEDLANGGLVIEERSDDTN